MVVLCLLRENFVLFAFEVFGSTSVVSYIIVSGDDLQLKKQHKNKTFSRSFTLCAKICEFSFNVMSSILHTL